MIKILKYEPMQKGSLIGKASILIEEWKFIINDIAIFEKDGKRWASFPQSPKDIDGERKWMPVCCFHSKDLEFKFSDKMIEALNAQAA